MSIPGTNIPGFTLKITKRQNFRTNFLMRLFGTENESKTMVYKKSFFFKLKAVGELH